MCHARESAFLLVIAPERTVIDQPEYSVSDVPLGFARRLMCMGVNYDIPLIGLLCSVLTCVRLYMPAGDLPSLVVAFVLAVACAFVEFAVLASVYDYASPRGRFAESRRKSLSSGDSDACIEQLKI